jgi:ketosteroid isomerase-like protein
MTSAMQTGSRRDTELPAAVQRFLDAVQSGRWDGIADHLAPDVVYDASVPGWHHQYQGVDRVAREYREEWTGRHPWRVVELHTTPTAEGVVVDFEVRGAARGGDGEPGSEEACRIANIFRLAGGLIVEHRFYCCGECDPETVRRIDAQAPRIAPRDRSR